MLAASPRALINIFGLCPTVWSQLSSICFVMGLKMEQQTNKDGILNTDRIPLRKMLCPRGDTALFLGGDQQSG